MDLKLNFTLNYFVYADDVNTLGWRLITVKKTQKFD